MKTDFLSQSEMDEIGFASLGKNVCISRNAVLLSPHTIRVGDHTRIDAFCVLSASEAGLIIGRNVHISAYVTVLGRAAVEIGDFATVSVRCSIFSSTDDYSGATMTNPTVALEYRTSHDAPVRIEQHALLATGCVVLPGVTVGESAVIGALSLVKRDVPAFAMAAGVPARIIGERRREHRALAEELLRRETR